MNKLHLCEKCAAEMGVETITKPKHALGEFLQAVQQQMEVGPSETGQCTFCSATLKDFRATGRLGCARCYAAFEGTMRDLLRRVHGQSRHVGRRYEHPLPGEMDESTLLGELRDRLRRAIDSEQFELAADLRDRIREHE
ncbi:MAG: UvrB/UvrC motif-containing protein [Gemmatimonadaceae bacterium]